MRQMSDEFFHYTGVALKVEPATCCVGNGHGVVPVPGLFQHLEKLPDRSTWLPGGSVKVCSVSAHLEIAHQRTHQIDVNWTASLLVGDYEGLIDRPDSEVDFCSLTDARQSAIPIRWNRRSRKTERVHFQHQIADGPSFARIPRGIEPGKYRQHCILLQAKTIRADVLPATIKAYANKIRQPGGSHK
jgi:hypothetical protein